MKIRFYKQIMISKIQVQRCARPLFKRGHIIQFSGYTALVDMSNNVFTIVQRRFEMNPEPVKWQTIKPYLTKRINQFIKMLKVCELTPLFFFDYSKQSMNLNWINWIETNRSFTIEPNGKLEDALKFNIMNLTIKLLKKYRYRTELVLADADQTIAARYENLKRQRIPAVGISMDFDIPLLGVPTIRKICCDGSDVHQKSIGPMNLIEGECQYISILDHNSDNSQLPEKTRNLIKVVQDLKSRALLHTFVKQKPDAKFEMSVKAVLKAILQKDTFDGVVYNIKGYLFNKGYILENLQLISYFERVRSETFDLLYHPYINPNANNKIRWRNFEELEQDLPDLPKDTLQNYQEYIKQKFNLKEIIKYHEERYNLIRQGIDINGKQQEWTQREMRVQREIYRRDTIRYAERYESNLIAQTNRNGLGPI